MSFNGIFVSSAGAFLGFEGWSGSGSSSGRRSMARRASTSRRTASEGGGEACGGALRLAIASSDQVAHGNQQTIDSIGPTERRFRA